jgi:hypothetical protein
MGIEASEIFAEGKESKRRAERSLLSNWAVRDLGISMLALSKKFELSISAISFSVKHTSILCGVTLFKTGRRFLPGEAFL